MISEAFVKKIYPTLNYFFDFLGGRDFAKSRARVTHLVRESSVFRPSGAM